MSNRALMERQWEIAKMYAMYWQAMAVTGACQYRDLAQGREPTAEERAQGIALPMVQLTPEEKTKDALETMKRHIHRMNELSEMMAEEE